MQSVTAILDAITRRETTPAQSVAASLDAIDARDADIGAFEYRPDRASVMESAEMSAGPLAGIVVGVKDIFDTHDMPTSYGSAIHAGHRPSADAALVAMMRSKGAVVAGKTVSTEFAFLQPAATKNPRNHAHTPGGSSSGSAAAVAAGMVPVAIGTQTGGSIIRPAAYCGVAGYKPSFRMIPLAGCKTFSWSLDTAGFFAASVRDAAEFVARLTGRELSVEGIDPKALRIGLYRSENWAEASQIMRDAVENAARLAEAQGATIIEIDEREPFSKARLAHSTLQDFEAGMALGDEFRRSADRLSDILRATLEKGRATTPDDYDESRRLARRARADAGALFETVDIVLSPSAMGAAPKGLQSTGSPIFNKLWTLTGNPCVNVPGLKDDAGMPLGLQIVARFGRDRLALSAAHWLENLLDKAGNPVVGKII